MYGITNNDIEFINDKINFQKKYLENFTMDFGDTSKSTNMLDNTYSANLNPKKYFSEINNRVNTMFNNAKEKGLKPVFVTLTAPSQYHRKYKDGKLIIEPNETAKDLTQIWNKFTSLQIFRKMKKELGHGLVYFRVYEPHKSSVPHLHAMIFIPVNYILDVKKKYKEYFSSSSWGANKNAIDFKYTWYKSKGGAVGYIMKYITKTFKDEDTQTVQHAVYWYIKHKVRRFLSSRTLAPLSIYRKVRYYFKNKYKDDFKIVSQKLEAGVIYKSFDDTQINYIFYNHDTGEVEEIIVWSKNIDLILNKRAEQELESIKAQNQREEFNENCKAKLNKDSILSNTKEPLIVLVDGIKSYVLNETTNKFNKTITIPSKLKDYQLVQYYRNLQSKTLYTNTEIKHFILTSNEMVKRDLKSGVIESLNDTTEQYGF